MTAQRSAHLVLPAMWTGLCLAMACVSQSWAMSAQGTLGDYIFSGEVQDDRRAPPPPVARYVSDEGESFVLDRSSPTPLLRFEDSPEVWVLSPEPAARGDVIYRDDEGEAVLRATKLGGLTLFAHGRPGGAPVALAGQAVSLRLQALSANALLQKLGQASLRASHAARRLIWFDAQEVTPGSEAVFADAAAVAAEAVVHISLRKDHKTLLSRFGKVLFLPGARSTASVSRGVMNITVSPAAGIAGRPSSNRIVQAVAQAK